jgi:nitrogen fixation protein NifQ
MAMELVLIEPPDVPSTPGVQEEIADVAALLAEFSSEMEPPPADLVARMAMASMGPNHLWEDLGLKSRDELNALMQRHFPRLKAMNSGNMRWKKFLYRLLCERAEVLICKSPHCEACDEYALCFDQG